MEKLKFKSNIKCMGCVSKVTPFLNETVGENKWTVDINNPAKVLEVSGEVSEALVKEAVAKAGFTAERM